MNAKEETRSYLEHCMQEGSKEATRNNPNMGQVEFIISTYGRSLPYKMTVATAETRVNKLRLIKGLSAEEAKEKIGLQESIEARNWTRATVYWLMKLLDVKQGTWTYRV